MGLVIFWFDSINHPVETQLPNSNQGAAEIWQAAETSPGVFGAKSLVWDSFAEPPTSPAGFVPGGYGPVHYYGGNLVNMYGGAVVKALGGNFGLNLGLTNFTAGHDYEHSIINAATAPPPVSTTGLNQPGGPQPLAGEFFFNSLWWLATQDVNGVLSVWNSSDRVTWTIQDSGGQPTTTQPGSVSSAVFWDGTGTKLRFAYYTTGAATISLAEFDMSNPSSGWGAPHDPVTLGSSFVLRQLLYSSTVPTSILIYDAVVGGSATGHTLLARLVSGSWTTGQPASDTSLNILTPGGTAQGGSLQAMLDPDGTTVHSFFSWLDTNYTGSNPQTAWISPRFAYCRCASGAISHTQTFDSSLVGTPNKNVTFPIPAASHSGAYGLIDPDNNRVVFPVRYLRSFGTGPAATQGVISAASVSAGGLGYAPGDTGGTNNGDGNTTYTVLTVNGSGAVLTFSLDTLNGGSRGYLVGPNQGTFVNTGSGDGNFTMNVTAIVSGIGPIATATVSSGHAGTGYSAGDTGVIYNSGMADARYHVTSVSGGAVTAATITAAGQDYFSGQRIGTLPLTGSGDGQLEFDLTVTSQNMDTIAPAVWIGTPLTAPAWTLVTADTATQDNAAIQVMMQFGSSTPPPMTLTCPVGGGSATVGTPYTGTLVVTNGTSPYTFSLFSGSLPPGFSLDPSTGIVSGTTTTNGSFRYTAQVTDSSTPPQSAQTTCTITVTGGGGGGGVGDPAPFVLMRVAATLAPDKHLPVRGRT